jgi:hypothetical protein
MGSGLYLRNWKGRWFPAGPLGEPIRPNFHPVTACAGAQAAAGRKFGNPGIR